MSLADFTNTAAPHFTPATPPPLVNRAVDDAEVHEQVVREVVNRLRGHGAVQPFVGDRVFTEEPAAGTQMPYIMVGRGRQMPAHHPRSQKQMGAVVYVRAADEQVPTVCHGVRAALNTTGPFASGGCVQSCQFAQTIAGMQAGAAGSTQADLYWLFVDPAGVVRREPLAG